MFCQHPMMFLDVGKGGEKGSLKNFKFWYVSVFVLALNTNNKKALHYRRTMFAFQSGVKLILASPESNMPSAQKSPIR